MTLENMIMTRDELIKDLERNAEGRDPRPCRRCGITYHPGTWNFYDFCNSCFREFDQQKMTGRLRDGKIDYFESSTAWLESLKNGRLPVPPTPGEGRED